MESVGLNRMGLVGNPLNPTPFLDSLASNGLFFQNFIFHGLVLLDLFLQC